MVNYTASKDFNSTNIRPMWMRPIVDPVYFLAFRKRYNVKGSAVQMYMMSAGLPGRMGDEGQLDRGVKYYASGKDEAGCSELQALVAYVGPACSHGNYWKSTVEDDIAPIYACWNNG